MGQRGRKGVGLSSSQRTKLRRLVAKGKLEVPHKWGDAWPMTDDIRKALGIRSVVDIAQEEHAHQTNAVNSEHPGESHDDKPADAARAERVAPSRRRARPILAH